MSQGDYEKPTASVPDEKLAALATREAKRGCEIDVVTPDGVDSGAVDKWDILDNMTLGGVEYDDTNYDTLICHFEYGTMVETKTHAATRTDAAAYETQDADVHVSIWWDMTDDDYPAVNIEVML